MYKYRVTYPDGSYTDFATPTEVAGSEFEVISLNYMYAPNIQSIIESINNQVVVLTKRAYELVLDKTGTMDYLKQQRELYELKVSVAKGEITDPTINSWLESEAEQENAPSVEIYKQVIIDKYEASMSMWKKLMSMIERGRTKILTLLEQEKYEQVDAALQLTMTILDIEDTETVFNETLSLN